jgi:hypothetical protein
MVNSNSRIYVLFNCSDLLGALYAEDASKSNSTKKNSITYLKEFFDYKDDIIDLL